MLNKILGKAVMDHIELDRVHRTPEFKRSSNTLPQDVLCRVHFFVIEEEILRKAASLGTIDLNGIQQAFFPDLSRRTLFKCRALRFLTTALREAEIPYKSLFPFALSARKNGRSGVFRSPLDLQNFITALGLEAVEIETLPNPPAQRLQRCHFIKNGNRLGTMKKRALLRQPADALLLFFK